MLNAALPFFRHLTMILVMDGEPTMISLQILSFFV